MFSSRSSLGLAAELVLFPKSPGAGHRSLTAKGSGTRALHLRDCQSIFGNLGENLFNHIIGTDSFGLAFEIQN
jgi:hypothetical protein